MAKRDPRLRAFVKVDKLGQVVPGTLILRYRPPEGGTSHYWMEIEANVCCPAPFSNYTFSSSSNLTDNFLVTVGGATIVNTSFSTAGQFNAAAGQTVVTTLTGGGPTETLLIVDETSGAIITNQTGTTGTLTATYVPQLNHVYSIFGTSLPTTTTTTTTTTTSTTTTTTTTI